MKKQNIYSILAIAIMISVLVFAQASAQTTEDPGAPSGNGVQPVFVADNATCGSLGYGYEFKVEPVDSGTYGNDYVSVTLDVDGSYFDWTSIRGVDVVVVKGGPDSNKYVYDPESFGDTSLHAPINPNNGEVYGLSHVSFCYDFELDVTKDAKTTYTRTFEWDIEKSVTPETWDLFKGDSGTSLYTVAVTKDAGTDSAWAVSGEIYIENNSPYAAMIESVTDVISGFGPVPVDCKVVFPHELETGASLTCTYATPLPDGVTRLNEAVVTTSGKVGGNTATADVIFGSPTTKVNDTINVEDTYAGYLGEFSASGSVAYERTFTCYGDKGEHQNIATIVETGQSDDAWVEVNCYSLKVTKDAYTELTRTWVWDIDKSADQDYLLLTEGQLIDVNYAVTVDTYSVDSDWAVSGKIWVKNLAPMDATILDVKDLIKLVGEDNIDAWVDCGLPFPMILKAGETMECEYKADLPDASERANRAFATLQNYDYDYMMVATEAGTTTFVGTANVDFSSAVITEVDECINVSDTNVGFLGTVCAADAPNTFEYSLWFGAHPDADVVLECYENTHENIAKFITNDTLTEGWDKWTVNADVECDFGCTLTPGYWKTHSMYGPAPYDLTWALLGEDTPFFSSGKSYYEVLWTAPKGGNAYYILAHAYIAAELNILNETSSTPQVDIILAEAKEFFENYTPAEKLSKEERSLIISYAGLLDNYNNGLIGPGHCSE